MAREERAVLSSPAVIYFFFPVYNEGESVIRLLARIEAAAQALPAPCCVLIVDAGSSDGIVQRLGGSAGRSELKLLQHDVNKGLAAALATGLRWLEQNSGDSDIVVMMDGDDTHDPGQVPAMLAALEGGADVVIGSRFRRGALVEGVALHRQVLSAGAALFAAVLFHLPGVRDYTCGFRAVRAGLLRSLARRRGERLFELQQYGFVCALELLVKLGDEQPRFAEVPLILRYQRKTGRSKMQAWRTIAGFLALWRLRRRGGQ